MNESGNCTISVPCMSLDYAIDYINTIGVNNGNSDRLNASIYFISNESISNKENNWTQTLYVENNDTMTYETSHYFIYGESKENTIISVDPWADDALITSSTVTRGKLVISISDVTLRARSGGFYFYYNNNGVAKSAIAFDHVVLESFEEGYPRALLESRQGIMSLQDVEFRNCTFGYYFIRSTYLNIEINSQNDMSSNNGSNINQFLLENVMLNNVVFGYIPYHVQYLNYTNHVESNNSDWSLINFNNVSMKNVYVGTYFLYVQNQIEGQIPISIKNFSMNNVELTFRFFQMQSISYFTFDEGEITNSDLDANAFIAIDTIADDITVSNLIISNSMFGYAFISAQSVDIGSIMLDNVGFYDTTVSYSIIVATDTNDNVDIEFNNIAVVRSHMNYGLSDISGCDDVILRNIIFNKSETGYAVASIDNGHDVTVDNIIFYDSNMSGYVWFELDYFYSISIDNVDIANSDGSNAYGVFDSQNIISNGSIVASNISIANTDVGAMVFVVGKFDDASFVDIELQNVYTGYLFFELSEGTSLNFTNLKVYNGTIDGGYLVLEVEYYDHVIIANVEIVNLTAPTRGTYSIIYGYNGGSANSTSIYVSNINIQKSFGGYVGLHLLQYSQINVSNVLMDDVTFNDGSQAFLGMFEHTHSKHDQQLD